jgi:hypothetical protein
MFLTHKMTTCNPIATNVTVNGLRGSGLRKGDVIKSNDAAYFRIDNFMFNENKIIVETITGDLMHIMATNKIDLVC